MFAPALGLRSNNVLCGCNVDTVDDDLLFGLGSSISTVVVFGCNPCLTVDSVAST